jgi:8-oxo-dGTP pyrophosphatase MutT (NUDIX family)
MTQATINGTAVYPVSVKAIVPCGGRILLLRNRKNLWDIPGGKMDAGETAGQALARECTEEMGFAPTPVRIFDTWVRPRERKPDVFILFYVCEPIASIDAVELGNEHLSFQLFEPHEIAGLSMHSGYRDVLLRYLECGGETRPRAAQRLTTG